MSKARNALCIAAVLFVGSCVGVVDEAELSPNHPANPSAAPGWVPKVGAELDFPASPAGELQMDGDGDTSNTPEKHNQAMEGPYECPMHEQVRSKTPGRCPICGMTFKRRLVNSQQKGT